MTDMSLSAIRARWESFGGAPSRDILHLLDLLAQHEVRVDIQYGALMHDTVYPMSFENAMIHVNLDGAILVKRINPVCHMEPVEWVEA